MPWIYAPRRLRERNKQITRIEKNLERYHIIGVHYIHCKKPEPRQSDMQQASQLKQVDIHSFIKSTMHFWIKTAELNCTTIGRSKVKSFWFKKRQEEKRRKKEKKKKKKREKKERKKREKKEKKGIKKEKKRTKKGPKKRKKGKKEKEKKKEKRKKRKKGKEKKKKKERKKEEKKWKKGEKTIFTQSLSRNAVGRYVCPQYLTVKMPLNWIQTEPVTP